MAFPALKVTGYFSVKSVAWATLGKISVESGPIIEATFNYTVAKEVASFPDKPAGIDVSSGLETCLIGEATGTDADPGKVPVKVESGVN